MKRYLCGIWALASLFLISFAPEADASALKYLKRTQAKLNKMALANASDSQLKRAVNKLLDFEMLSQNTMVKHWSTLTAQQKTEFRKTFRALLEKKYIKGIRKKATYTVVYKGEKRNGATAKVTTEVNWKKRGRDRQETVVYRMRRRGAQWLVTDVITGGVSMEQNYRNDFNRIIQKKGFDDLMKKLKKRVLRLKTR